MDLSPKGEYAAHYSCVEYGNEEAWEEVDDVCDSVEGILSFARDRAAACRRTRDVVGAKTLLEYTKGLKASQELWRD